MLLEYTIRNYITLKLLIFLGAYCVSLSTIRNYITLKLKVLPFLPT